MSSIRQTRNTRLFLAFLLLAGICYRFSNTGVSPFDALMTSANYVILTGLLLFWIRSVRMRLLPSASRACIRCAAFLMLFYMLLRIFNYRFVVEDAVKRHVVYAYWIPQLLIPALFLLACLRMSRGEEDRKRSDWMLLMPAAALVLFALTNDRHGLVYAARIPLEQFAVETGTYTHGPLFYLFYVFIAAETAAGLFLLIRESGRLPGRFLRDLLIVITLGFGMSLLDLLVLYRIPYRFFNSPECNTFSMLGVFEVCIRYRLIPYNENYSGFFAALPMPVLITDRAFVPVYRTQAAPDVSRQVMNAALTKPQDLADDWVLYGRRIRAGYAFWAEDESAIRLAQARLEEAGETIRQENDLIRAETEQKEKEAYLRSRHQIYHEIAAKLYPVQKRIGELLEEAAPGTEGFARIIAEVSVLNAYVKRKTNLLLLAAEQETLRLHDLFLALQESGVYLTLAGLQTTAAVPEDEALPSSLIVGLYDAFEMTAEQLVGEASSLMVSWNDDGLRLAAETDHLPEVKDLPLPAVLKKSEDVLYIVIRKGKEGGAS